MNIIIATWYQFVLWSHKCIHCMFLYWIKKVYIHVFTHINTVIFTFWSKLIVELNNGWIRVIKTFKFFVALDGSMNTYKWNWIYLIRPVDNNKGINVLHKRLCCVSIFRYEFSRGVQKPLNWLRTNKDYWAINIGNYV